MSVLCVLSCVTSSSGPDILLITGSWRPALVYLSSVLVHSLWLPLQEFELKVSEGVSPKHGRLARWRKWSLLILQAFHHFTYITAHSPTLPSLYQHHSSFSNPYIASPLSQLILQPFFRLSYVTEFSLTSPGEPPMLENYSILLKKFYLYNPWNYEHLTQEIWGSLMITKLGETGHQSVRFNILK